MTDPRDHPEELQPRCSQDRRIDWVTVAAWLAMFALGIGGWVAIAVFIGGM